MSRFNRLKKHLPLTTAIALYVKIKLRNYRQWEVPLLKHPFNLRDNPYDYATFEEVILEESYRLHPTFSPKTILDAGANIGLTAAYFASRYPQADIVSLEPDRENFEWLQKNTSVYKNVVPLKAGLWSRSTHLSIIDTGEGNNAFRVQEVPAPQPGSIEALSVKDIMQRYSWDRIDLLKMDIEGAEKEIFEADTSWLAKVSVMVIELHDRFKPGCREAFLKALLQYRFSVEEQGENLVCTNISLS